MNTTSIPSHLANPYTAPASDPVAPVKLFSIGQIGLATFLAVPAGLALMAVNFRRTGKVSQSNATWLLAPIVTVLLVVVGLALPEGAPTFFIPLLIALAAKKVATTHFAEQIADLDSCGGKVESRWTVAGAVVAGTVACLAVAALLMAVLGF